MGIIKAVAQREIILNTTGYGFDKNSANGINPDQWEYIRKFASLKYNGQDASVTAVRLHIQWEHYEPSPGNYQRDKIKKAVQAILDLNPDMKIALHFAFMRNGYLNDTYFDASDIAQTSQGALVRNSFSFACPSIYSDYAAGRFYAFVNDVLQEIEFAYPRLLYAAMGNNPSEEFYVPGLDVNSTRYPGMFEPKSLDAWRNIFLPLRFPDQETITWGRQTFARTSAPLPIDGNFNSEIGRDMHRYAAWGLLNLFKGFYDTVKARNASIKVLHFISDVGSVQGNNWHLQTSTIPLAFELADGVYHTDGTDQYDLWKKIMGIDCLKGTYPNKIAALEFDPSDLGQTSSISGVKTSISNEWFPRAFRHGAEYLHLAMHFSDFEMQQIAPSIAAARRQFITPDYQPPARSAPFTVNIYPNVFTGQFLFDAWKQIGGEDFGHTDLEPKSIRMTDQGYWTNVWDTADYLPCTFSVSSSASTMHPLAGTPVMLSVSCNGGECDQATFVWSGNGTNNQTGQSIIITAPVIQGDYTYTVASSRSGCMPRTAALTLNVVNPLPVKLISFTAVKEGHTAMLAWATSEETNSEHFEIHRSTDGQKWSKLGTVQAAGESRNVSRYQFSDDDPVKGQNLYRLKLIDRDQTFAYSRIINLGFESSGQIIMFPNPVTDRITIAAKNWETVQKVQITSIAGKVVYQSAPPETEIRVENLVPGNYIIEIIRAGGEREVMKFLKK